jgi:hypothetical protein
MLIYLIAIWNNWITLGIFYEHLVHFVLIWHIFFRFWYNTPKKNLATLVGAHFFCACVRVSLKVFFSERSGKNGLTNGGRERPQPMMNYPS